LIILAAILATLPKIWQFCSIFWSLLESEEIN
jgi:hypothetical protein